MPPAAQTLKDAPAVLNKQYGVAQHVQPGVDHYRDADYAAGRVEFEAVFGLSLTDLLHNLSLTIGKQGQVRKATKYGERY